MIDFHSVFDYIQETLFAGNKKTLVLCVILVFMTLCAAVVLSVQQHREKNSVVSPARQQNLELDQSLLVPDGPAVPDGYGTSRITAERWDAQSVEEWFMLPDEAEIKKLGRVNDTLINDIVGAAP